MASVPLGLAQTNPNYAISIFGSDENGDPVGGANPLHGILSPMPEDFSISTMSEWHPLLDGVLKSLAHTFIGGTNAGALAISSVESLARGAGIATNQAFTQLLWESTSPITFSLPLKFNAIYDANDEVTQPILALLKLCLPSNGSNKVGFSTSGNSTVDSLLPLQAPGPRLYGGSYNVNIAIGNMFIFPSIIVRSVNATFHTLSVDEGDFLSADVQLEISTSKILTKTDLDAVFKNKGQFGSYSLTTQSTTQPYQIPANSNPPAPPITGVNTTQTQGS